MAAVAAMRHEGGGSDVMECRVYPCGGNRTVGMICTGKLEHLFRDQRASGGKQVMLLRPLRADQRV